MNYAEKNSISRKTGGKLLLWFAALWMMAALFMAAWVFPAYADGGLELVTDYPGISVKPGDSLNLTVQVDNLSGQGMEVDVGIRELPEGWEGYLRGGNYQVSRIYVGTGTAAASLTLQVTVPDELEEGTYQAVIGAVSDSGAQDELTIRFDVTEENAGRGSFTSEYPEQEGASGTSFSFSTTLINNGLQPQSYSLSSNAPAGWSVNFTPSGETTRVASVEVESGASQGFTVSVTPTETVEAGEYTISCSAISAEETLNLDLTVQITGTYGIDLATPDGRLSFDAQANQESDVTLQVVNTGNVDLENVSVSASAPSGWTVTYEGDSNVIDTIAAGSTAEVVAHVKPSSDAITGDYVTTFTVNSDEVSDRAEFRVSVKTSTAWGIVAVLLILCTAGGLGYVFKKYGRR